MLTRLILEHVGMSLSCDKHLISFNNTAGNNVLASCAKEKSDVLSILPLPDYGGSDGFYSAAQHINHIDNVDNQLMAGSTPVGYCNPSEAKPKVIIMPRAVILLSRADPVDCPDSFRPADWLQPTTSLPCDPAVASTNRYDKFDSTLDYFNINVLVVS